jgi:fucose permease
MYKKRLVFWSACIGMLLFGVGLITLGSIAPDLKVKLQLNEISSGAMFSILPFGILTGSLLFGPVVDKYGYKILMAASCVLMFAGFEGIAIAQSSGVLKIFIFLIGLGGGAVNGSTNALVADISDKDKGANLSLLGVFFGIGALGMPLILGILENRLDFEVIIASIGLIALVAGIFFIIIRLPPPKQPQGFPLTHSFTLLKDNVLLLIAFFLFFQSSFEGIINNWTTTYLINRLSISQSHALYALSSFVAGMALMRLVTGSVLRNVSAGRILTVSFTMILISLILLKTGSSYYMDIAGLVLLGGGLAGGFPIMLGFVGSRYAELSGTAFSFVLFVGLLGNMLINYLMGIISQNLGIKHLITVAFGESVIMIFLCLIILKRLKKQ